MTQTGPGSPLLSDPLSELELVRAALVSEYDVLEELGRGGMAVVYRAHDRQLDREVALKVLPRNLLHDAGFIERFQREGRIAARLEHPHIVPIYRVGQQGDVIYFAMKHLRGGSLASRLKSERRLPPSVVHRILVEVGDALDCAGSHHIVHRDIKPENILFDEAGRCVVTDFGIAKSAAESQLTGTGQSIGTPHYMSPEQARGAGTDVRSDLYSLGVVAYHCLTGKVPFDGPDNLAILFAQVTISLPTPALPTAEHELLFRIIRRLMAKQPSNRIQSGRELIRLLNREPSTGNATVVSAAVNPVSTASPLDLIRRVPHFLPDAIRSLTPVQRRIGLLASSFLLVMLAAWSFRGSPHGRVSLCPAVTDSSGFLVLLDPVPAHAAGSELAVFFDVCGLAAGTPYSGKLRLARQEEGLKKLLGGGPKPLVSSFQERAEGPAIRRRRSVETGSVRPGRYTLELMVTDNRGRTRRRAQSVLITRQ